MPEFISPQGTRVECSTDLARVLGWDLTQVPLAGSQEPQDAPSPVPAPEAPVTPKRRPGRPRKAVNTP